MSEFIDPHIGRAFAGRRVLVTGHTGFKGGWLSAWLLHLGADVVGLSLPPSEGPGVFKSCGLADRMDSRIADIRDRGALQEALRGVDAERASFDASPGHSPGAWAGDHERLRHGEWSEA